MLVHTLATVNNTVVKVNAKCLYGTSFLSCRVSRMKKKGQKREQASAIHLGNKEMRLFFFLKPP